MIGDQLAEVALEEMTIRQGGWEDEQLLGALLSVSFSTDPFVRWLMPNPVDFQHDSQKHPRRAYSQAFEARTFFVIGDFAGGRSLASAWRKD